MPKKKIIIDMTPKWTEVAAVIAEGATNGNDDCRQELARMAGLADQAVAIQGGTININGYEISITQQGRNKFTVKYGTQTTSNLPYGDAAREYGSCVMHALCCEGKLKN